LIEIDTGGIKNSARAEAFLSSFFERFPRVATRVAIQRPNTKLASFIEEETLLAA
jgi:hypothetical protein